MTKIIITIDDSSSEAKVKIENTRIAVDIEYRGEKYSFNTHRDDPLRRMFLDFCDRLNLTYADVKFTLLGGRDHRRRVIVNENQTAEDLGMSDGDTIHASQENTTRIDVHIQYKGENYSGFNTHKDDPLRSMFLAFCHSSALAYDAIRFSASRRGRDRARAIIKETQTPDELGIGDGDTIYAEDTKIVVHVSHIGNKGKCNYAIRRHVPLRKMFLDFCNRLDVSYGELRFLFHGVLICETQTPDDLGMDDDDLIDALDLLYG